MCARKNNNIVITINSTYVCTYYLHTIRNLRLLAMARLNIKNTHYMYYLHPEHPY